MKYMLALLCATLALAPMTAHAAPKHPAKPAHAKPPAKSPAVRAADAWLAIVDSGNYDTSWQEAAASFKAHVTQAQWTAAMQQVRAPLGSVKTRTFASAKRTTTLPGAPAGDYAQVQYSTAFTAKPSVETIIMTHEQDGQWRVDGYFIR